MRQVEHENVIKVLDVFATDKNIFLVMEFAGGGELFDRVQKAGKLSESEARQYIKQFIDGIGAMKCNSAAMSIHPSILSTVPSPSQLRTS